MRILLLHADDADLGWWRHEKWGRVVDLGKAGRDTYERWSEVFGCPVTPFPRLDLSDFKAVRRTLFSGLGRMMDSHGIDWWELISMGYHERVERIVGLGKLAEQVGGDDEVFVSRAGFEAQVMELLLGRSVGAPRRAGPRIGKWLRIAGLVKKLRPRPMLEIVADKYDAGYSVRRWVSRGERRSERPVVLLPTAYVNVSRTGLAYAAALPERDFLLVATRQSGWIQSLPRNVKAARLASYAPGKYPKDECEHLLESWRELRMEFRDRPEYFVLEKLGAFEQVPAMLRDGLAVRDAWLQVLEREPVTAVLCADDSNTYTRLPLLLGRKRGLAAIACHHGALDGRHLIKRNHADVILAKGRMEEDYLVRTCGVAEEEIEIGAPPREELPGPQRAEGAIVFFSEPYELAGGRGIEFYREILPGLAEIAAARRCELVVKLHPQENLRERQCCVDAVLGPEQRRVVRMVAGRLNEELLRQAWFAVTVVSTTAVECTLRGIPVFLCGWLECTNWRYAEQFAKFGAGTGLSSPGELLGIPARLKEFERKITADLWVPIKPGRLDDLFSQREHARIATAV